MISIAHAFWSIGAGIGAQQHERDANTQNPRLFLSLSFAAPPHSRLQVERAFADAAAAAAVAAASAPPSPPIRPRPAPAVGAGGGVGGDGGSGGDSTADLLLGGDDSLHLLTPPPPPAPSTSMNPSALPEPAAAAAASGRPGSAADDGLPPGDVGGGLESDDDYGDAAEPGGSSTPVASVEEGDDDGLGVDPEDAVAVLPDLRVTASPPLDDDDGPGRTSSPSTRQSLSERLAAARDRAGSGGTAAAAAVAETPRSFSRRQLRAAGQPSTPSYRETAKNTGFRTAVERETQFLGSQM